MGNSNTSINLSLDRPQPTIYYTGDILSGQIECTIPERTGTNENIYLTINGTVGYTIMHRSLLQNGQVDRKTNLHDFCILKQRVRLGQIMSTQKKQYRDGITDMKTIEPGQYTYPFSVRLPDALPPTLHPKDYPFVRYQLELFVEKKWYSVDTYLHYPIRIFPRVNLLQINNSQCAVRFGSKCKEIIINGIIQRSGLVPGEQIMVSLDIYNPMQLTIKRIDICLIQRYEIEQCRRRLEMMRVALPQLFDTNDEHIETTCPLKIPMNTPPSYSFRSRGGRSSVSVNVHYDIRLEVKAKGFFSDFELQVPITIGTDSAEYSTYDHATATAIITPTDLSVHDLREAQVDDDDDDDDAATTS